MCGVERELRREKLTFTTVDVVERQEFCKCSGCEFLLIFKLTEIRLFKHVHELYGQPSYTYHLM
jgi:hypothetical protein